MLITGTVASGAGRANRAFGIARLEEVRGLFGWTPFPGTLNLQVSNLEATLSKLPEPVALTEHNTPIGPLRWWPVLIHTTQFHEPISGVLVRGQRTKTSYLELVAPVGFREAGIRDGDSVTICLENFPDA